MVTLLKLISMKFFSFFLFFLLIVAQPRAFSQDNKSNQILEQIVHFIDDEVLLDRARAYLEMNLEQGDFEKVKAIHQFLEQKKRFRRSCLEQPGKYLAFVLAF